MTLIEDLLDESHSMPPDALVDVVASRAAGAGLMDVDVFLVDYEQVNLVRLAAAGRPPATLAIDSTLAGRAFITGGCVFGATEGGDRCWAPLLDGGDRLGVLGVTVVLADEETRRLCTSLASVVALLLISKNNYTDQQEVCRRTRMASLASELQIQMLPPHTFVHPRIAIAGVLEDAYDTGGDAFDYAVNGGVSDFAIFDAMGHGLPASLLASTVVVAYRRGRRQGLTLAELYTVLDGVVQEQSDGEAFVTAHLGQMDIDTGDFTWVNAGHPEPLIVRQGRSVGTLRCEPSLPLGMAGVLVELATTRLARGDRLLFFSDGVVEAKAPDGEPFGEIRLADNLQRESLAGVSPAETMRRLLRAVLHHSAELKDDASMVMVEWRDIEAPAVQRSAS